MPCSGLELEGNLSVRKIKYRLRSSEDNGDTTQIVVPKELIPVILEITHCKFGSPHLGIEKMYQNVHSQFFWKHKFSSVEKRVKECSTCNSCKPARVKLCKLGSFPILSRPDQRVHMYLLTNFYESGFGHKHLLVIIDEFTRFMEIFPLRNKMAEDAAVMFFNKYICRYRVSERICKQNIGMSWRNYGDKESK